MEYYKLMVKKWSFVMILFIIVVASSMMHLSNGCVEAERMSLLDIKAFFLSFNSPFSYPLSSWVGANCCNWERVICNNSTSGGHVVELLLSNLLNYSNSSNYLLNISPYQNFKQLKILDLSGNSFSGFPENQGFNQISSFNKLETLDLSYNHFNHFNHFGNEIFSSLSGITSLKKLVLQGNKLEGSINLPGLINLKELDLSSNNLNGILQMQGLDGFSGIENLNLGGNDFNNSIFSSLRRFISLKSLDLQSNNLEGTLPTQDITKLKNLEFLDLSYNGYHDGVIPLQDLKNLKTLNLRQNLFNGSIPIQGFCETNHLVELNIGNNYINDQLSECVGNFTQLKVLDITSNQFTGKIPKSIFNLTSIETFNLGGNYFEGSFSLSLLANSSKLKNLRLTENKNEKFQVETEKPPKWRPTFQLELLVLRDCNINDQSLSTIPTFLASQHELVIIDIAHNKLVGTSPLWLLHNNSKLMVLDLSENSFTGPFQLPAWKNNYLFSLQIYGNKFSGQLPKDMGFFLPQLQILDVSRNSFEGNLPPSMQQMTSLYWLDVSNNKFYGNLQISIFNNKPTLETLFLANNNFSGSIEEYRLKDNTNLIALDISNNKISGRIPIWIGRLHGINYIQMSSNRFIGELPREICSLEGLQFLDVSHNQLIGGVPSCFNSTSSLVYLYMQRNYLSGPIPPTLLSSASSLKILDLSSNYFSGHIPDWIEKFTSLQVLLLKQNKLQGPIPLQVCQVREISIMDLSNNELNGSIPSCLSNITFGGAKNSLTWFFGSLSYTLSFPDFGSTSPSIGTDGQVTVEFSTKYRVESYKSNILELMSGLDLSNNKLTGQIPKQIGGLVQIRSLNFSHNKLVGLIPREFSNLKQLESLDLSNNLLSGNIPVELGGIDSLSTFNVSYNNLSGMIPLSPKFSSYPESSYYGNPRLCGLYIQHKCSGSILPPSPQPVNLEEEVHGVFIDIETFFWSFGASYIVILLGLVTVLYINPQWRERWFYFIEDCYYYVCKCIS